MIAKLKFIAPLLFLISCIVETSTITEYIVKNQTTHDLSLVLYHNAYEDSIPRVVESITQIPVDGESSQMHGDATGSQLYRYPLGESTDSVIIIFDDSRKLVYRRNEPDVERNILNIENYVERIREDNNLTTYTYTYTLTEKDYSNAVPVDE